ncbi:hypothetical protein BRADI_5g12865v3 [Brachypodium distachyon]|uniref:Secreted protein n=1 Tax=Brachypodium distachyon TaxID=15368 RepID=A0A0Q3IAA4_BRADI|nr:hypothetical protein BRADI_5g12865v3 [Brachypodium distachyon]
MRPPHSECLPLWHLLILLFSLLGGRVWVRSGGVQGRGGTTGLIVVPALFLEQRAAAPRATSSRAAAPPVSSGFLLLVRRRSPPNPDGVLCLWRSIDLALLKIPSGRRLVLETERAELRAAHHLSDCCAGSRSEPGECVSCLVCSLLLVV